MDMSVIISTRNRCKKLVETLKSIQAARVPENFCWEMIVVDNGSTDGTAHACKPFKANDPERFIYINEPKRGKSIALNRGISIAKGDILAFTDDDCIVDSTWFEAIIKEYLADPQLAILGGRVELYNDRDHPFSIIGCREKVILSSARMLLPTPIIIGCNMAAKKETCCSVGGFDLALGPGTIAIAEDMDFIYRAYKKGFKVVYYPSVLVYHNHGRQTEAEIKSLDYKYTIGRGSFYLKHILAGDKAIAKMACFDVWEPLKCVCTLRRGMKGNTRVLCALLVGAIFRIKAWLCGRFSESSAAKTFR
jgi:glycosyltransferase involved in cell wall biosynthesis